MFNSRLKGTCPLRFFGMALLAAMHLAVSANASLVDNGDGTITQTRPDGSKRMWLQDANHAATSGYFAYETVNEFCHTPNPATCFPISPQVGMTHADAIIWADTLDFAGHTDWRMPISGFPVGYAAAGATGEMLDLTVNEGIWRDAPGPFSNVLLSYWSGTSGTDFDDGVWNHLAIIFGSNLSQSVLQSKQVVVSGDLWVWRRFAAWAVRDVCILNNEPILVAEPNITAGLCNNVFWSTVPDANDYLVEVSEDVNFTSILAVSGWITTTNYEFCGLISGQRYWYRVQARSNIGCESQWSNAVSSRQCGTLSDFEPDCDVDITDLAVLADQWLQPPGIPSADIAPAPQGDGIINFLDLAELAIHWLEGV